MISKSEIGERLTAFMDAKGWSKTHLAEAVGVLPQNINRYLTGKSDQSRIIISLISHGLNPEWARTGEGEMYAKSGGIVQDNSNAVQTPDDDRLNNVLKRIEILEKHAQHAAESQSIQIPLFQHAVSAGTPCMANEEIEKYISIPKDITRHPECTYAVRANGDSMIGAGIETGDILIADQQAPVKDKCIVIASINGSQTVKRIQLQLGAVVLFPENDLYQAIPLKETDDVEILGTILGIYRQLY
ncbi:MAG: hypothetical protein HGB11_10780 [Chlorobiales bacterium]|nr:hypothetical protein [Chlorobiales bacterium]